MLAAGWLWVGVSVLGIAHTVAWYFFVGGNRILGVPVGCFPTGPAASWCTGVLDLPFLLLGYRTLAGRIADTHGWAFVSTLVGLLQLFGSAVYIVAGTNPQNTAVPGSLPILAWLMGLLGGALVLAGGFAMAGRRGYKDWLRELRIARLRDPD